MSSTLVLKGLVLRSADYRESSRMLTVLTDKKGKISVSAKGATRKNSRTAAASQLFAFSEMTVSESRDRYYLNEASTIELFDGLKADISSFALGAYFLELLDTVCQEEVEEPEALSLCLNALWLLSEGKKSRSLIKSVFELRLMCILGYMPCEELLSERALCPGCGCDLSDIKSPVIDLEGGDICCPACAPKLAVKPKTLCQASLSAIRHIIGSEADRVFSFTLTDEAAKRLSAVCEGYVKQQLERSFPTLDYYKKVL
jgi:DNA repair protein RecO (recombination protein O)